MKIVLLVLALLILLPLLIGLCLPSERSFIKTATLPYQAPIIWEAITDIEGQLAWRPEVQSIEMHERKTGHEKWTEVPKEGPTLTFQTIRYEPPHRFDIQIVGSGIQGHWEGRLSPKGEQTAVEFKEIITLPNPYSRVFSYLFVDLDDLMELYLTNLKTHLAQQAATSD